MKGQRRGRLVWLGLAPFLAIGLSVFLGRYTVAPGAVVAGLLQGLFSVPTGQPIEHIAIVTHVRLPRALVGAVVGGSLAAAGAAFQRLFQNPLVSPGLLGVTNGASFGAALAIVLLPTAFLITPAAFLFGVGAVC